MRILDALARIFAGDPGDPLTVALAPTVKVERQPPKTVAPLTPEQQQAKLDAAKARYGKAFATEQPNRVSRVTEPSHMLRHIQAKADTARKVTNIDSRRRTK